MLLASSSHTGCNGRVMVTNNTIFPYSNTAMYMLGEIGITVVFISSVLLNNFIILSLIKGIDEDTLSTQKMYRYVCTFFGTWMASIMICLGVSLFIYIYCLNIFYPKAIEGWGILEFALSLYENAMKVFDPNRQMLVWAFVTIMVLDALTMIYFIETQSKISLAKQYAQVYPFEPDTYEVAKPNSRLFLANIVRIAKKINICLISSMVFTLVWLSKK